MPRAVILQHVPEEGPGRIMDALVDAGVDAQIVAVDRDGCTVPETLAGIDGIVVMGGPMSVNDTARYPHVEREIRLVRKAIEAEVPVLGICLGAQLIARALDAKVTVGPRKEIGFHSVHLSEVAQDDSVIGPISRDSRSITVFQWHGEIFELPANAIALAGNSVSSCQAFSYGSAHGLLFHLEVTRSIVEGMLVAFREEWMTAGVDGAEISRQAPRLLEAMKPLAMEVFGRWAESLASAARHG